MSGSRRRQLDSCAGNLTSTSSSLPHHSCLACSSASEFLLAFCCLRVHSTRRMYTPPPLSHHHQRSAMASAAVPARTHRPLYLPPLRCNGHLICAQLRGLTRPSFILESPGCFLHFRHCHSLRKRVQNLALNMRMRANTVAVAYLKLSHFAGFFSVSCLCHHAPNSAGGFGAGVGELYEEGGTTVESWGAGRRKSDNGNNSSYMRYTEVKGAGSPDLKGGNVRTLKLFQQCSTS